MVDYLRDTVWRAVLGLPPIHIRFVVRTPTVWHVVTTEARRDALLLKYPGSTWECFTLPEEDTRGASLVISPLEPEDAREGPAQGQLL